MQYLLILALGAFFFKDKIFKKTETKTETINTESDNLHLLGALDYKDTPYVSDKVEPSKAAVQGQTRIETKSGLVTSLGSNPDLVVKKNIREFEDLKKF